MVDIPDNILPWIAVAAVAFLAGFARGLTGFGVGLIMMPITAYFYSQQVAVPLIMLIDVPVAFVLLHSVWGKFNWHDVSRIFVFTLFGIPLGIWLLLYVNPDILRRATSVIIIVVVITILTGFKLKQKSSKTRTSVIGFLAGLMEGSMALPAPPVILGWITAQLDSSRLRANIILYFWALMMVALPIFWISGLLTVQVVKLSLTLTPIFCLAALIGAKSFSYISNKVFNRIILILVMVGAISSIFG